MPQEEKGASPIQNNHKEGKKLNDKSSTAKFQISGGLGIPCSSIKGVKEHTN